MAMGNRSSSKRQHRPPPSRARDREDPFIFVSYARADRAQVKPELEELRALGYRLWHDGEIIGSKDFVGEIAEALDRCSVLLVFLSERAVKSKYVYREIYYAFERGLPLLAIYLEEVDLPHKFLYLIGPCQAIMKHRMSLAEYRSKLTEALPPILGRAQDDVAETNAVGRIATLGLLREPFQRLLGIHHALAEPRMVHQEKEFKFRPEVLFRRWTRRSAKAQEQRIAIVAPPGFGKTVLLWRFAQWLWEHAKELSPAHQGICPIVVYLSPGNLPEDVTKNGLRTHMGELVSMSTSSFLQPTRQDPLASWAEKGAIYVLFDGVDEFGARWKGELESLLDKLSSLSVEEHLTVVLTCRSVFWNHQVQDKQRDVWDRFEIQPLTAQDIADMVGVGELGPFAHDGRGDLKPGIRNSLIMWTVLELKDAGKSARSLGSRFELYGEWARMATAKAAQWASQIPHDLWLALLKDVAFRLLERKTAAIPAPRLQDGKPAPLVECLAMGILTVSDDRRSVRFSHESYNEFFLPLARVDLDFLQPSVYGFLHERLGDEYLAALRKALSGADLAKWPVRLVRNLVEYIGMAYPGGPDLRAIVDWLLDLMRSGLNHVIRYNAARALERIHPWAPKPYFDCVSDWGDKDWSRVRARTREDMIRPWAIRGYRMRGEELIQRKPGTWPALAVCRDEPWDAGLQAHVSAALAAMLTRLIEQLPHEPPRKPKECRPIDCLLINYSYAWTRWHDPEHRDLLDELGRLATGKGAGKETLENLSTWVGHAKLR